MRRVDRRYSSAPSWPGNVFLNLFTQSHYWSLYLLSDSSIDCNGVRMLESAVPVKLKGRSQPQGLARDAAEESLNLRPDPRLCLPAAQTAMASFSRLHRTADFRALFTRVLADMKEFIGTKNDVLVLASSGTGVMEGSVSNLTSPAESGFDRRQVWRGGPVWPRRSDCGGRLSVPYGETFSLDEVKGSRYSEVRVVYVQATESSTGARHDIRASPNRCAARATTRCSWSMPSPALGTTHFDVDGWGIDLIIGGSQKALMIPPWLGLLRGQRARVETNGNDKSPRLLL